MRFSIVVPFLTAVAGCVSQIPRTPLGLQPAYHAVNPARIVFLPPVVQPDPSRKAVVDTSALTGDRVLPLLEATVLASFQNQPEVNGLSPNAFRKLIQGRPELATLLESHLKRLAQTPPVGNGPTETACRERASYLDFYAHCVAGQTNWKNALADVASVALNADAFLFVIVTELEKAREGDRYSVTADVTTLLVDANGGNLMWGRQQRDTLASDASRRTFPEWSALLSRLLSEPFWMDFPGRKQKN